MNTIKATPFLLSIRFSLSILAFFAYAIQHAQNIAMSVAIVCMVNNSAIDNDLNNANFVRENFNYFTNLTQDYDMDNSNTTIDSCNSIISSQSKSMMGTFEWSKNLQGIILSSYFFGYIITEIPGGWLALNYGAKYVLAIMILFGSIFTILLPFAARFNYLSLIIVRVIIGASLGGVWPAAAGFWPAWAPPSERSTLIGIANAGAQIGNVATLQLGGYLCENGFDGGWPSIFYLCGGLGLVWFVIWCIFSANSPSEHRFIGNKEKDFIEEATRETIAAYKDGGKSAPWSKIMSSRTCLAIFTGHTCQNFGTYMFLTQLPTYMREILKFDIKSNGLLSAIPYFFFWLFIILSGIIGDRLINKCGFKKNSVRKIFNSLGFFVPMFSVLALTFVTCEIKYIGVLFLTLGLAFTGCAYGAGFSINYNDASGAYAGVVFGIGNTFATLPGIIAPYVVGVITKSQTQQSWQIVFVIAACIYLIGILTLLFFSKAEIEPWAILNAITIHKNELKEEVPLNENITPVGNDNKADA